MAEGRYAKTVKICLKLDKMDESSWIQVSDSVYRLRNDIMCTVCGKLALKPVRPVLSDCHHVVCKSCVERRISMGSDCAKCGDYNNVEEHIRLRLLLHGYKKMCELLLTSKFIRGWRHQNLNEEKKQFLKVIHEGASYKDSSPIVEKPLDLLQASVPMPSTPLNDSNSNPSSEPDDGMNASSKMPDDEMNTSSKEPDDGINISSKEPDDGINTSSKEPDGMNASAKEPDGMNASAKEPDDHDDDDDDEDDDDDDDDEDDEPLGLSENAEQRATNLMIFFKSLKERSNEEFVEAAIEQIIPNMPKRCHCAKASKTAEIKTCSSETCPCYANGRGCTICRCKGCKNPRENAIGLTPAQSARILKDLRKSDLAGAIPVPGNLVVAKERQKRRSDPSILFVGKRRQKRRSDPSTLFMGKRPQKKFCYGGSSKSKKEIRLFPVPCKLAVCEGPHADEIGYSFPDSTTSVDDDNASDEFDEDDIPDFASSLPKDKIRMEDVEDLSD